MRQLEIGELDDVESDGTGGHEIDARVRTRPFIFGDPLRNKKPVSVRLSSLPETVSANVSVRLYGDDKQFQQRDVIVVRGGANRPRPTRVRMGGGKASAIQVEVEFNGRIQLQAIEAVVRMLDEVP